ncbi:MAG: hypothetical protein IPJ03_14865 [Ignavibacteriales bacterium]|nr:hypothetical protein [Ignavibacteriales bacterium]MBK7380244.1 hypothetical protein [Ignavibacteriales bacterium]
MNKEFDCVEMKRKGARILQKKLAGLSLEEELKFWQERTKELKEDQKRLRKKKKRLSKV